MEKSVKLGGCGVVLGLAIVCAWSFNSHTNMFLCIRGWLALIWQGVCKPGFGHCAFRLECGMVFVV